MADKFRVTLRKSPISYTDRARATVRALGLHRIGETVEINDNAATRGMARAVNFLVDVEEIQDLAPSGAGTTAATAGPEPRRGHA